MPQSRAWWGPARGRLGPWARQAGFPILPRSQGDEARGLGSNPRASGALQWRLPREERDGDGERQDRTRGTGTEMGEREGPRKAECESRRRGNTAQNRGTERGGGGTIDPTACSAAREGRRAEHPGARRPLPGPAAPLPAPPEPPPGRPALHPPRLRLAHVPARPSTVPAPRGAELQAKTRPPASSFP